MKVDLASESERLAGAEGCSFFMVYMAWLRCWWVLSEFAVELRELGILIRLTCLILSLSLVSL